jgi:hypothetical protein
VPQGPPGDEQGGAEGTAVLNQVGDSIIDFVTANKTYFTGNNKGIVNNEQ